MLRGCWESFATLLEDRAADPLKHGLVNEALYELADAVRDGKAVPRNPATLTIFRGVFFDETSSFRLTQVEIDSLEKIFFEPEKTDLS